MGTGQYAMAGGGTQLRVVEVRETNLLFADVDRIRFMLDRYVHGPRFVKSLHGRWPETGCRLQVLDFGVHPERAGDDDSAFERRNAAEPDFPCEHRYRARTSVISSSLFTKNVESSLPYREVTTKVSLPYSGFMIDDERIIGLQVGTNYFCS